MTCGRKIKNFKKCRVVINKGEALEGGAGMKQDSRQGLAGSEIKMAVAQNGGGREEWCRGCNLLRRQGCARRD